MTRNMRLLVLKNRWKRMLEVRCHCMETGYGAVDTWLEIPITVLTPYIANRKLDHIHTSFYHAPSSFPLVGMGGTARQEMPWV